MPATWWIIARSSCELYIMAPTLRKIGGKSRARWPDPAPPSARGRPVRPARDCRETRPVPIAEEDEPLVPARDPRRADERRARRPLGVQAMRARRDRVRPIEDRLLSPREHRHVAFPGDRKPAHRHAVHVVAPGRQLVGPCHVVARAGRQNLGLMVPRKPFRHVTRVLLGAPVDVGAVALDNDRQLHCGWSSVTSRPSVGVSSAAAMSGVVSAVGRRSPPAPAISIAPVVRRAS